MAKHLTVKELINKLQKLPPNTKVIFSNDDSYNSGMYYVTEVKNWEGGDEEQVELKSDYKSIAKDWEDYP